MLVEFGHAWPAPDRKRPVSAPLRPIWTRTSAIPHLDRMRPDFGKPRLEHVEKLHSPRPGTLLLPEQPSFGRPDGFPVSPWRAHLSMLSWWLGVWARVCLVWSGRCAGWNLSSAAVAGDLSCAFVGPPIRLGAVHSPGKSCCCGALQARNEAESGRDAEVTLPSADNAARASAFAPARFVLGPVGQGRAGGTSWENLDCLFGGESSGGSGACLLLPPWMTRTRPPSSSRLWRGARETENRMARRPPGGARHPGTMSSPGILLGLRAGPVWVAETVLAPAFPPFAARLALRVGAVRQQTGARARAHARASLGVCRAPQRVGPTSEQIW